MDLETTTFRGRNLPLLHAARDALGAQSGQRLRILQVGPGLSVRYLGRWQTPGTPFRPFFKGLETLVRRLPMPDGWYENYESAEILEVFGSDRVDLTVVDINPRVVEIVAANLLPAKVETHAGNFGDPARGWRRRLGGPFDVAISLTVLHRIASPEWRRTAVADLVALTRSGGIIAENSQDYSGFPEIVRLAPALYRRI